MNTKEISKYPAEFISMTPVMMPEKFSIEEYLKRPDKKINGFCNGIRDAKFALDDEIFGCVDLFILKLPVETDTYLFLADAIDKGYTFTGYKGLVTLLEHAVEKLPKDSWVLSPNRMVRQYEQIHLQPMPYYTDRYLSHSGHSVSSIRKGMYILLGKQELED